MDPHSNVFSASSDSYFQLFMHTERKSRLRHKTLRKPVHQDCQAWVPCKPLKRRLHSGLWTQFFKREHL